MALAVFKRPQITTIVMKASFKFLAVAASVFALFGLSACCDTPPAQAPAPAYEAPAK